MSYDVFVKLGVVIPESELEISASKSGGPGGQHVNKTESRITVRWNVKTTLVLSEEQKERVLQNLQSRLTGDGDLIINEGGSRSQQQNRESALARLGQEIRKALHVPKKRKATRVSLGVKKQRVETKRRHGETKKMRSVKVRDD